MKKINLIDAVIDWFDSDQAGEHRAKYHPEIISLHIASVFEQLIYKVWLQGKETSDFNQLDAWSRIYNVSVTTVGGNAYAVLPFAPVQLPDNEGIRQVCDHGNNSNVFIPTSRESDFIFGQLDEGVYDSTPTYSLEQNSFATGAGQLSHILRLRNMPTSPAIESIDVFMIVPFEKMDDYDDITIPGLDENSIIKEVINLLISKPNPDKAIDDVVKTAVP